MIPLVTIKCDVYHRYTKVGRLEIENGKLLRNDVYTDNILLHPCPRSTNVVDILGILKSRVLPECRCDAGMLQHMGLKEYNVWDILRHTHGVDFDDFCWLKFDGEDITWDDVRVR